MTQSLGKLVHKAVKDIKDQEEANADNLTSWDLVILDAIQHLLLFSETLANSPDLGKFISLVKDVKTSSRENSNQIITEILTEAMNSPLTSKTSTAFESENEAMGVEGLFRWRRRRPVVVVNNINPALYVDTVSSGTGALALGTMYRQFVRKMAQNKSTQHPIDVPANFKLFSIAYRCLRDVQPFAEKDARYLFLLPSDIALRACLPVSLIAHMLHNSHNSVLSKFVAGCIFQKSDAWQPNGLDSKEVQMDHMELDDEDEIASNAYVSLFAVMNKCFATEKLISKEGLVFYNSHGQPTTAESYTPSLLISDVGGVAHKNCVFGVNNFLHRHNLIQSLVHGGIVSKEMRNNLFCSEFLAKSNTTIKGCLTLVPADAALFLFMREYFDKVSDTDVSFMQNTSSAAQMSPKSGGIIRASEYSDVAILFSHVSATNVEKTAAIENFWSFHRIPNINSLVKQTGTHSVNAPPGGAIKQDMEIAVKGRVGNLEITVTFGQLGFGEDDGSDRTLSPEALGDTVTFFYKPRKINGRPAQLLSLETDSIWYNILALGSNIGLYESFTGAAAPSVGDKAKTPHGRLSAKALSNDVKKRDEELRYIDEKLRDPSSMSRKYRESITERKQSILKHGTGSCASDMPTLVHVSALMNNGVPSVGHDSSSTSAAAAAAAPPVAGNVGCGVDNTHLEKMKKAKQIVLATGLLPTSEYTLFVPVDEVLLTLGDIDKTMAAAIVSKGLIVGKKICISQLANYVGDTSLTNRTRSRVTVEKNGSDYVITIDGKPAKLLYSNLSISNNGYIHGVSKSFV